MAMFVNVMVENYIALPYSMRSSTFVIIAGSMNCANLKPGLHMRRSLLWVITHD